ncbi:putative F-box protein At4g17565 [Corylus avellana]|uniref:putative F-box protein At4g17565 n=1 Tax=Corylus avellana TaxID=13451 RepID=UPI001E22F774|nr:putative F-box protein At4g17565 [Corylus avellana]
MARLSDLPNDLIETILTYPTDVVNLYNYRDVCRSWRSIVDKLLTSSPPHLLLFEMGNNIRLLNIFTGDSSVCKVPVFKTGDGQPLRFPTSVVSGHGWLAINFTTCNNLYCYTHHFFLYNPFSRSRIRLPTFTFDYHFQNNYDFPNICQPKIKFVLPSKPTNPPQISVVLATGKKIIFWKSGDEEWTPVDNPFEKNMPFFDMISYKGGFCAIDYAGNVAQFEFNPLPRATIIPTVAIEMQFFAVCVVESLSGDLLMVCISQQGFFSVFKLDWETMVWGEITSLGDDEAIFMAGRESVCVRAGESTVYKNNCIYFRSDGEFPSTLPIRSREDFGVYNMANKIIHRFSQPLLSRTSTLGCYQWLTTHL